MKRRILLDTQAFLWLREGKLTRAARRAYLDPDHEIYLSLVSVWEIVIKTALKKLVLDEPPRALVSTAVAAGTRLLSIDLEHILQVHTLPRHHSDPFDRLLIAQALREDMAVLGSDELFDPYGVVRIW